MEAARKPTLTEPFWVSYLSVTMGEALMGTTVHGLFCLLLGRSRPELESDFRQRFRLSTADAEGGVMPALREDVTELLARPERSHNLALDPLGTPFQLKVWDALRQIPTGQTRTYKQIAESLGNPQSARAVGQACASNPLAIAIPCHRVVASDVHPLSYAWGPDLKLRLLQREGLQLMKSTGSSQTSWDV